MRNAALLEQDPPLSGFEGYVSDAITFALGGASERYDDRRLVGSRVWVRAFAAYTGVIGVVTAPNFPRRSQLERLRAQAENMKNFFVFLRTEAMPRLLGFVRATLQEAKTWIVTETMRQLPENAMLRWIFSRKLPALHDILPPLDERRTLLNRMEVAGRIVRYLWQRLSRYASVSAVFPKAQEVLDFKPSLSAIENVARLAGSSFWLNHAPPALKLFDPRVDYSQPCYGRTLRLVPDAEGGKIYLLVRNPHFVEAYEQDPETFAMRALPAGPNFSDALGYAGEQYYETFQAVVCHGDLFVLIRDRAGVDLYRFSKGLATPASRACLVESERLRRSLLLPNDASFGFGQQDLRFDPRSTRA